MSNFGVNFNFDFGNLKLDKLFEDANKSGKADLSSNQQDVTSNYQANSANSYGGTNSSDVETMNLSANVKNNSVANNVDTNNVSDSAPSTSQTDSNVGNSNVDISQPTNTNNTTNGNTMSQENVSATENNNINVNASSNSGSTVTNSNSNQTDVSMNNNSTNNSSSNNTGIDIDNNNVDVSANNSNSNVDVNSNNNMSVNTNSNSGTNNSGNTNTNMNVNTNGNPSDNSSVDVSLDLDANNNESSSSGLDIKDGKVYVTSTDMEGNPISVEIDIDDYINNLKSFGFNDTDIKRITDGKITPEELMDEIQKDTDTTRKQQVMESSYLKACGLDFNNMDELKKAISDSETELNQLTEERNKADNKELDDIMIIISRLKQGETFENIINSEIVCWKYTDEAGNICYTETDPYQFGGTYDSNGNPYQYEPLTFIDMYGESDYYRELEEILTASTVTSLFGGKNDTIHRWEFTEEQEKYFDEIAKKYSDNAEKRDNTLKELDSKIKELQSQKASYEYIYEYINKEISYYLEYVDAYTSKEDFSSNVNFNNSCLEKVEEIKSKNTEINLVSYQAGLPIEYINNKEDLISILACMINGEGDVSNGFLRSGNNIIQLSSTDDMLAHYQKWLPFVTEDEVQIFNYIYNTEGTEAAYNYLENISDELDNRWLANKTQEDQEFASEHPVLASIGSIVVTPIEGISAACYSMNSYLTGEKIRRADVYSAGDVWRSQVSQDIAENYGEGWAFVYNTGMSMADSATLIALSAATGGVATPILSATLMGSRAYVSTLNDALDRGLSDGAAVGLALTSAVVETAMESYSVGHLLNLEEHLGKNTIKLAGKIASNIENETVANLVTKGFYLGANALSQGLAEGEEEFATEILNYVADIFIAKDLSNYSESINQYLSNGYTEEQALISTMIDFSGQAFQAFLGGFASGICFGTFGGVSSTIKTSNGISMQMYNDLYGKTSAQQFTSALEINQQQLEDYSNALNAMKNGESLTQEQMQLLNNGTIEMQSALNLKQQMKQNLRDLGISIKNIFSQSTINNTTLQENSETQHIASDMMKVYDLIVEQGIIENLISKAKGENGKVAGVELFRMLGYDAKPTVVQSEEFDILTKISQYGTLVRGISGENSQLYVDQFINGEMYVGGTHAAIKGTGIYTGFGLSAEQIGEKYATRAGTETGGSVIEMILNQEAKVIEYSDILSEQNQVLDSLALEFSKYNPEIKDFDTLFANLTSITDSLDLQKAKFVTNFLTDTGYYAALRGYDAIVDSSVNYLTVLNRGKLTVKDVQNASKSSTFINERINSIIQVNDNLITGNESTEELHDKLLKLIENKQEISLQFLNGLGVQEKYDYILANISEINLLYNSKEIQEFMNNYFSINAAAFTYTIVNKLTSENINQQLIDMIINLDDEQFTGFVNRNTNDTIFENEEIFNRAIHTGINFIYGLSDNIKFKMLNNDTYISNIIKNGEISGMAKEIPAQYVDLFLDKINFESMEIQSKMKIIENIKITDSLYEYVTNNQEIIDSMLDLMIKEEWTFEQIIKNIPEKNIVDFLNKIDIKELAPANKYKIIKSLNETVSPTIQKEIITNSGIINDLNVLNDWNVKELLKSIKDSEFLYELFENDKVFNYLTESGSFSTNIYNMIGYLDSKYQLEYISNNCLIEDATIYQLNEMLKTLDGNVIEDLLVYYKSIENNLSADTLLSIYLKTNNDSFLSKVKELASNKSISSFYALRDLIIDNNLSGLFSIEEYSYIFDNSDIGKILDYYEKVNDDVHKEYFSNLIDVSIQEKDSWNMNDLTNIIDRLSSEQIDNIIEKLRYISIYDVTKISEKLNDSQFNYLLDKIKIDDLLYKLSDDRVYNYLLDKFKANPKILMDISANDISWGFVDEIVKARMNELLELTDVSDKLKFISSKTIENNEFINEMIQLIRANPDLISNISDNMIKRFLDNFTLEERISLYNSMNFKTLTNIYSSELSLKEKDIVHKLVLNNFENFSGGEQINLLRNLNLEDQLILLNDITSIKSAPYSSYFANLIKYAKSDEVLALAFRKMEYTSYRNSDLSSMISEMDKKTLEIFKNNCSDDAIIKSYFILLNSEFEEELIKRFNKNSRIFETVNDEVMLNIVMNNLTEDNKNVINNYVDSVILSKIGTSSIELLEDSKLIDKCKFLYALEDGLINDEKVELLKTLKKQNKFVLQTFNYQLFNEDIYQFGSKLISKLSKYPSIVDQFVELKKDSQKFNLFANLIKFEIEENNIIADSKMAMLLNYILKNDIDSRLFEYKNNLELDVVRNILLKEIDQFSILDRFGNETERTRTIVKLDNFSLENYNEQYNNMCDMLIKDATTVEEVQHLIFNKYFNMTLEDAQEMFRMYGSKFSGIADFDENGIATTYLTNLYNILQLNDMNDAQSFYNNFSFNYNMNENLKVINEIKKAYTKSLKSTLYVPEKVIGTVNYNGIDIPIYSPDGDFQMLIQSTHTNYGGMPLINDSYFDSWNLSERTSNHGICCSLISSNNMGMAKVVDDGIVIGFNSFSDEQMNMMAPYDIYTRNDGYVIKCQRPLLYLPGNEVMDYTRHTHNEFNLERTNLTGEGKFSNIQPDYVVVFEEMDEGLKENAYKASIEFNIPLVYINKTQLAQTQSTKIDSLIEEFNKTGNLELAKQILILHENNRSGYRNPTDVELMKQYFPSEKIRKVMNDAVATATTYDDLEFIKEFLQEEMTKFDITYEATNRANTIDILVDELIEEIESKQKSLLDNTAEFKLGSLFKKVNSKMENRVSSQMSNFSSEQIQWINQVNDMIKHGQSLSINLKNTKSITSQMLAQISDLSKLSIRMDLALSDFNGNYMNKYNKEKYLKRVTYTGAETYFILQKMEQLENMVDKNLPITLRAKRIYDIISSEIPVMRNYSMSDNHYLVSQSLRGIVSNNIIGESGLICAGYASLFRELCTRCGIQCDYIRGRAVLDLLTGKGGGHAWNIFIDEHGNPIAVDVTWNASGGGDWFGGSEEFQKTHIPDNDERFKDYLLPANLSYSKSNIDLGANQNNDIVSKEKIIENILSTMVQKYGEGSGLDSLIQYARTGDKTRVTRQNGARDSLQYITQDDIIKYIKFKNNTINNIINAMDQKYGKGSGIDALRDYVVNKNEKIITRQNGARDSLKTLTIAEIKEYIKLYF